MKTFQFGLCSILLLPFVVYGRLGEKEQQLVARFGVPVATGREITLAQGKVLDFGKTLSFREGVWSIVSVIIDGRCAREVYSKPGDWTEDQFTSILTANSQGALWTDTSQEMIKKLVRKWKRADGAEAIWQAGGAMVITHPAYDKAKKLAETKAKTDASEIPKIYGSLTNRRNRLWRRARRLRGSRRAFLRSVHLNVSPPVRSRPRASSRRSGRPCLPISKG